MITNIHSSSPYVIVNQSNVSLYGGGSVAPEGNLRYNFNNSTLEVYKNACWTPIVTTVSVGTTGQLDSVVRWASEKMMEEQTMKALAEKNPSIADLVAVIDDAKAKISVIKTLIT